VTRLFQGCADAMADYGANGTVDLSACSATEKTHSTRLNCAMAGDPLLRGYLQEDPGRTEALLGTAEKTFNADRGNFLSEQPISMDQIAGLMASGNPSLKSGILNLYQQVEQEVAKNPSLVASIQRSRTGAPRQHLSGRQRALPCESRGPRWPGVGVSIQPERLSPADEEEVVGRRPPI
jgi:hypothetical protein